MSKFDRAQYREGLYLVKSALAAFYQTGDPAYAMRAYLAIRWVERHHQQFISLWRADLDVGRPSMTPDQAAELFGRIESNFRLHQDAVFAALDACANELAEPRKASQVVVDRGNVVRVMSIVMDQAIEAGATQSTLWAATGELLGLSVPNVRKHWEHALLPDADPSARDAFALGDAAVKALGKLSDEVRAQARSASVVKAKPKKAPRRPRVGRNR